MFGGAGVFRDDLMFGLVTGGELYLKADEETVERFRAAGSRPFTFTRQGKPTETSYWSAPAEALDDPAAMVEWAEAGFQAALRAKAKPLKKNRVPANGERSQAPRRAGSKPARSGDRGAAARRER